MDTASAPPGLSQLLVALLISPATKDDGSCFPMREGTQNRPRASPGQRQTSFTNRYVELTWRMARRLNHAHSWNDLVALLDKLHPAHYGA
jgi:hypothetical protein